MTYNLNSLVFENDFGFIDLADGKVIVLNSVNEDILAENGEAVISAINIVVVDKDGAQVTGINVIGMSDEYYTIKTEYDEYLGLVLNKENISYCTLEVKDD